MMRNLLNDPVREEELVALLASARGARPLGAPGWSRVAARPAVVRWREPLLRRVEAEAGTPLPGLTGELYADFYRTGNRLRFESVYFERRRRLARVAMAVLLGGPGAPARHAGGLIAAITAVAGEVSWALPAHVSNPSGQDPRVIDLFSAETANLMGELLVVFGGLLPVDLAGGIRRRLREDFFENYAANHASLAWTRAGMNWNAVCHQGVLGAALATEADPARLARLLMLAREALPHFIGGFGEDGSTSEGPGYWQYGFGRFAELNAQIEARTDGAWSLFEGHEKVARIAHFAPRLMLRGGYAVNFSDNERRFPPGAPLLAYLGGRLRSEPLRAAAAAAYARVEAEGADLDERRADFFYLSRLALRSPERCEAAVAPARTEVFFPDYQVVVASGPDERGNHWEFAAKAGSNHEHHNHNDCGSFILHVNGAPGVMEIGLPEYVRDYFNEHRYEFLAARSSGHSVPLVNGCEQIAGERAQARVIACELTERRAAFSMELAACYPPEARCLRLVRSFVFDRGAGRLSVSDEAGFDGEGALESLLITECPAGVEGNEAWIRPAAAAERLRVVTGPGTRLAGWQALVYRNHHGVETAVNRLRLHAGKPARSLKIEYAITLAGG